MADNNDLNGPDLYSGISVDDIADNGMLQGHVGGEAVLVARVGSDYFAIGAHCTHYGAPLSTGIIVEDTVRCPWHHACFSLRTGKALRPPALDSVPTWKVETRDGKLFVRDRLTINPQPVTRSLSLPRSIVIVGGGGAGNAAAETLRSEGYDGRLTLISADDSLPYDRPTLSKDFLEGNVSETSIALRSADFYREKSIQMLLNKRVTMIDVPDNSLRLDDGSRCDFDALLLATGAEPTKLEVPGALLPRVFYLRTRTDCHSNSGTSE